MNYLMKRNINAVIERSQLSRNIFLKLYTSLALKSKRNELKKRAKFYQNLYADLKAHINFYSQNPDANPAIHRYSKSSFYNENQIEKKIGYRRFQTLIVDGDNQCLQALEHIRDGDQVPKSLRSLVQENINKIKGIQMMEKFLEAN